MPTIRRTIIITRMATTCGRTTLILNNTRLTARAPHTTGITGIEFTTATTVIIITIKRTGANRRFDFHKRRECFIRT
jgi:hypothetical protein